MRDPNLKRSIRILRQRLTGFTLEQIGALEELSRERVRQIEARSHREISEGRWDLEDLMEVIGGATRHSQDLRRFLEEEISRRSDFKSVSSL